MIDNLKNGIVNCVVECNPDAGIFVKNAISRYLSRGRSAVPKEIYVHETVFQVIWILTRFHPEIIKESFMKKTSIKGIFQQTNKLMILVAFLPLLISSIFYSRQIFIYQNTINNIEEANQLSGKVDAIVLEEMWDLVFGQKSVADVQVNNVIEELRADLDHIQTNTNTAKEKNTLAVALRTLDSLETYQNKLIENIANDEPLEKINM